MNAWESLPTKLLPPAAVASISDAAEQNVGIWCMQIGAPEPLQVAAAKCGFKGCPDNILDKLLRHFGLGTQLQGASALKGVLAKTEALIKHCLPGIDKNSLAAYLQHRSGLSKLSPVSVLFTGENLSQTEGVLDQSDHLQAKQFREKQKTVTIKQCSDIQFLQQRGYLSADEATSCMHAAGGTAARPVVEHKPPSKEIWSWTEKHLKTCTPNVKGATIHEITNQYSTAWVAKYKGAKPHASHTISYGKKTGVTSEQAARGCMIWLWNAHRQAFPEEECPFKFADMAFGDQA